MRLGLCRERSAYTLEEKQEVVRLYYLAFIQGNAEGQVRLGLCYENGLVVEKDINKAAFLYQLSADQGNAEGQAKLRSYCERNMGSDQKRVE